MKTIIDLFESSVSKFPKNIYLWEKENGEFKGTTYEEVRKQVLHLAAGFQEMGMQKGDRVGLISEGRNQWIISELAVLYAGATTVPLSVKLSAGTDLYFRLKHSGSRFVIASAEQIDKIEDIRAQLPDLEAVIHLDAPQELKGADRIYQDVITLGKTAILNNPTRIVDTYKQVQPDDVANISYTSGTTADPKGIMLSQLNYTENVRQAATLMHITPEWKTLAFLPWDHAFAHTACLYCFMYFGASVASLENGKTSLETLRNIPKNIQEIKPDMLMSVPAVAKNFRKNIEAGIRAKGTATEALFKHALNIAYKYNGDGHDSGQGARAIYKPLVKLYDKIVFSKIRASFGGNLKMFIGGGALLDTELQRFFYAIGIPMCQGYGLSEASPIISSNALHAIKFGSSGKLVDFMELQIRDADGKELPIGEKGEICIKGDNVMRGYWQNEEATAETLIDGWLHTGDMGRMDTDGFLYVLGRFKSLLIGEDGEKFSPEGIEEALVDQSKYIDQCMLYNNQNPYTSALLVPNTESISRYLKAKGYDLQSVEATDAALRLLRNELNQYKKGGKFENQFPERWLPSAVVVLPEAFSEKNQQLNSTMKMVRNKIMDSYADELTYLYTKDAKQITNKLNQKNIKYRLRG
ncbi:MAG: AMP-dependent synthetase/ligase [Mangrovibacterium sp.]